MESGKEKFVSHCRTTVSETPSTGVDRRQFLQYAAGVGATLGLSRSALGQMTAAQMDNRLPDGTEYVSWEQPLTFSKTYYVDNSSAKADDNGPGSQARPVPHHNQAAEVLQPGERVVIAAGTYRECVRPARGGTGPAQMISYEAAPGAKVVIKGSEVLKDGWQQESVRNSPLRWPRLPTQVTAWQHELTAALFPDAYNPFALPSVPGDRAGWTPKWSTWGRICAGAAWSLSTASRWNRWNSSASWRSPQLPGPPPPNRPQPLSGCLPAGAADPSCRRSAARPMRRFWVENSGTASMFACRQARQPTTRSKLPPASRPLFPLQKGLAYIRVKGITFQHAGNGYPVPQRGLVSTAGGNHWIIEGQHDRVGQWRRP